MSETSPFVGLEFSAVLTPRLTFRGMPGEVSRGESAPMLLPLAGGSGTVLKLVELVMILELLREGLNTIVLTGS